MLDLHQALPTRATAGIVEVVVTEYDRDARYVAMPRAETQLVVRFGSSAHRGLDVHAMGARPSAKRKLIRRGQWAVTARLRLGTSATVLGVSAAELAGRVVPLADLWGGASAGRLEDRLAGASGTQQACAAVEDAIAERFAGERAPSRLLFTAAKRLEDLPVSAVARELGMSERTLRRLFHEAVGLSPKAVARLARFHRALRAARATDTPRWADIAFDAGYYDQAHLIAEFRDLAGVTPTALLDELR